jgi:hypothetical protein
MLRKRQSFVCVAFKEEEETCLVQFEPQMILGELGQEAILKTCPNNASLKDDSRFYTACSVSANATLLKIGRFETELKKYLESDYPKKNKQCFQIFDKDASRQMPTKYKLPVPLSDEECKKAVEEEEIADLQKHGRNVELKNQTVRFDDCGFERPAKLRCVVRMSADGSSP